MASDSLFRGKVEQLKLSSGYGLVIAPNKVQFSFMTMQMVCVRRDTEGRAHDSPFNAMTFSFGCMIAESAVTTMSFVKSVNETGLLGRRMTLFASDKSTITTWFVSFTFSRLVVSVVVPPYLNLWGSVSYRLCPSQSSLHQHRWKPTECTEIPLYGIIPSRKTLSTADHEPIHQNT